MEQDHVRAIELPYFQILQFVWCSPSSNHCYNHNHCKGYGNTANTSYYTSNNDRFYTAGTGGWCNGGICCNRGICSRGTGRWADLRAGRWCSLRAGRWDELRGHHIICSREAGTCGGCTLGDTDGWNANWACGVCMCVHVNACACVFVFMHVRACVCVTVYVVCASVCVYVWH